MDKNAAISRPSREWLETNGSAAMPSSPSSAPNTRRYHGLLTAATTPGGRMLLLSKLEETLVLGGQRIELSANEYPGASIPEAICICSDSASILFPYSPSRSKA